MSGAIRSHVEGPVATITIDRPAKKNALTHEMVEQLSEALKSLESDPTVRGIVISGAGGNFSTGADLSEAYQAQTPHRLFTTWRPMLRSIEMHKVPVIAAIDGYCLTGGLELAMACDLRFAAPDAKFAVTSAKIGSVPGSGATQRLPRLIGLEATFDMLFTARFVDAPEALRLGLVSQVPDDQEVVDLAQQTIEIFAERAPLSIARMKRAVRIGLDLDMESALEIEGQLSELAFATKDKAEGMQAFLEKRTPKFIGA